MSTGAAGAYRLLQVADWDEGIAFGRRLAAAIDQGRVSARLRWVGREPGSGAAQCLDEVLGRSIAARLEARPWAQDHRGVAEAIRGRWADAGICLRLASEEAGLSFLCVRQEAYEICFPDALADDPRMQGARPGRAIGGLSAACWRTFPAIAPTQTGELRRFASRAKAKLQTGRSRHPHSAP